MLEILTGAGLATASGLNAFIPLLAVGLLARFTDLVTLPGGWAWLENPWVLGILAVLLVLDLVADKIPAVDHVNDWVQTFVRPTAGGIVFGAGSASQTAAVQDPAAFFSSNAWVPIAIGIALALVTHLAKAATRATANAVTGGVAAPVLSIGEDAMSIGLVFSALIVPVLVLLFLVFLALFGWWMYRSFRRVRDGRRRKRGDAAAVASRAL